MEAVPCVATVPRRALAAVARRPLGALVLFAATALDARARRVAFTARRGCERRCHEFSLYPRQSHASRARVPAAAYWAAATLRARS